MPIKNRSTREPKNSSVKNGKLRKLLRHAAHGSLNLLIAQEPRTQQWHRIELSFFRSHSLCRTIRGLTQKIVRIGTHASRDRWLLKFIASDEEVFIGKRKLFVIVSRTWFFTIFFSPLKRHNFTDYCLRKSLSITNPFGKLLLLEQDACERSSFSISSNGEIRKLVVGRFSK